MIYSIIQEVIMHPQDYQTEIIQLLFQLITFLEQLNKQESQFLHQLNDYVYEKYHLLILLIIHDNQKGLQF